MQQQYTNRAYTLLGYGPAPGPGYPGSVPPGYPNPAGYLPNNYHNPAAMQQVRRLLTSYSTTTHQRSWNRQRGVGVVGNF